MHITFFVAPLLHLRTDTLWMCMAALTAYWRRMPTGNKMDLSLTLLLAPVVQSSVAHEQDLKLTCWARTHSVSVPKPLCFVSQRMSFPHSGACKLHYLDTVLEKHRIKSQFLILEFTFSRCFLSHAGFTVSPRIRLDHFADYPRL